MWNMQRRECFKNIGMRILHKATVKDVAPMRWIVCGWPKPNEAASQSENKATIGLRRGYDSVKPDVLQSSSDHSAESDAIGAGAGSRTESSSGVVKNRVKNRSRNGVVSVN